MTQTVRSKGLIADTEIGIESDDDHQDRSAAVAQPVSNGSAVIGGFEEQRGGHGEAGSDDRDASVAWSSDDEAGLGPPPDLSRGHLVIDPDDHRGERGATRPRRSTDDPATHPCRGSDATRPRS